MTDDATSDDMTYKVMVEFMPLDEVEGHVAAGNWGRWPHNGAVREIMYEDDALDVLRDDGHGYARIIPHSDEEG